MLGIGVAPGRLTGLVLGIPGAVPSSWLLPARGLASQ